MLLLLGVTLLLTVAVVIGGVALVAFLGDHGDDASWSRWSDIGQAFGVVNSVVSAFAVAALVITWTLQMRDRRDQQAELVLQRRIVEGAEAALRRSADVDFRRLHVTMTRMAVDHPHLAEVWPSHSRVDPVEQSQHMYANLLLQLRQPQDPGVLAGHRGQPAQHLCREHRGNHLGRDRRRDLARVRGIAGLLHGARKATGSRKSARLGQVFGRGQESVPGDDHDLLVGGDSGVGRQLIA